MKTTLTALLILLASVAGAQDLTCKDVANKTRTPAAYESVLRACITMSSQHSNTWYQLGKRAGASEERARLNGECAQVMGQILSQPASSTSGVPVVVNWPSAGTAAPNAFTAAGNPIIAEQQRQEAIRQQEAQTRALQILADNSHEAPGLIGD